MTDPTIEAIVDRVLEEAKAFVHENSGNLGMSHTFGYFTDHPVARLNRERLTLTLEEVAERAPAERASSTWAAGEVCSPRPSPPVAISLRGSTWPPRRSPGRTGSPSA